MHGSWNGTRDHRGHGHVSVSGEKSNEMSLTIPVAVEHNATMSMSPEVGTERGGGELPMPSARSCKTGALQQHVLVTSAYILFWLFNSIALILFNKSLLSTTFPYPATLTCVHMLVASAFCRTVNRFRGSPRRSFDGRIFYVAVLFTVSLVLRNSAYKFVSVAIIQMVSAFSPLAVYVATCSLGLEKLRTRYFACILVVSAGICLSSYGFVSVRWIGVLLQTVGIGVEAFRTALLQLLLQQQTQKQELPKKQEAQKQEVQLQKRPQEQSQKQPNLQQCSVPEATEKYDNITLMSHMAPISAAILLPMGIYEVGATRLFSVLRGNAAPVLANSVLALGMNLASLLVIQVSSSLTISLASIVRDWALVCISFLYFGAHVSSLSAVGWCITTAGLMFYTALKNNNTSSSFSPKTTKATRRSMTIFSMISTLRRMIRSVRHEDLAADEGYKQLSLGKVFAADKK